jgi:hypothetical protein
MPAEGNSAMPSRRHNTISHGFPETVDQAASDAIAMLQEGERLSRLWRYVFAQVLDDSSCPPRWP